MDWKSFFEDLQILMANANDYLKQLSLQSEDYWSWLVKSLGELGNKYGNHPLVVKMLIDVVNYQQEIYDKTYKEKQI